MWKLVLVVSLSQAPSGSAMKITVAKVQAAASKPAVTQVLKDQLEALKGCYDLALKESPGTTGNLSVTFDVVAGTRKAAELQVTPGGIEQQTLQECLLARLGRTDWPKAKSTNHVELTLHFALAR